jgi:hypothetical protein
MRSITVLIFGLFLSICVNAQCDKQYYYQYTGTIKRQSVHDTLDLKIFLPKDYYLTHKHKKQNIHSKEIEIPGKHNMYSVKFSCFGPCKGSESEYLSSVFIIGVKEYPIKIQYNSTLVERKIDVNKINFIIKGNLIEIELPEIEI